MTKRYALIDSTGSVNVIIWDGREEYNPDGILIDVSDRPEIDSRWAYDNGEFIPPSPSPDEDDEAPLEQPLVRDTLSAIQALEARITYLEGLLMKGK